MINLNPRVRPEGPPDLGLQVEYWGHIFNPRDFPFSVKEEKVARGGSLLYEIISILGI